MLCVLESSMHNLSSFVYQDFLGHSFPSWFFVLLMTIFFVFLYLIEYKVHAYNRNGICSLGFMDDHYPVRSAFSLLNQVHTISFFLVCVCVCFFSSGAKKLDLISFRC